MLTSKQWWYAAGIRALKTWAQTLMGTIPSTIIITQYTDWGGVGLVVLNIVGSAVLAAFLSLLWSLSGLPEVPEK